MYGDYGGSAAALGVFANLRPGVRYDYFNGSVPAQSAPAGPFAPARDFPAVYNVPNWKDISPRSGVAIDLFGDGGTAVKVTLGRFENPPGGLTGAAAPVQTSVNSVSRNWTDTDGDFVPNCDLLNPLPNGECQGFSNLNFGKNNPNATTFADGVMHGFDVRPYDWNMAATIQRHGSGHVADLRLLSPLVWQFHRG
jgi:hypothetical protein